LPLPRADAILDRSMSARNVAIVREVFALYARGDFEALAPFLAPDFEMEQLDRHPEGGVYLGQGASQRSMEEWAAMFDDFEWEPEELLDAGEHVVAIVAEHGRPRGGGLPLDERFGLVFTFRDERIARMRWCHDRAEALRVAGLPVGTKS
jgi:ketosteroid isomerase-like protein